jgi:hypothetical protein
MFSFVLGVLSDDFEFGQQVYDLLEALTVIFDDCATGAGLGLCDLNDFLAAAGPTY